MNGNVTQLVQLAIMISAILGAVFLGARAVIETTKFLRRMTGLYELLAGAPADGDNPARPGLNTRMREIERWMGEHDTKLSALASLDELKANGGSTIKDQVNRIEAGLMAMETSFSAVKEQVDVNTRAIRSAEEPMAGAST